MFIEAKDVRMFFYHIKSYCEIDVINNFITKIISDPLNFNSLCYFALPFSWIETFSKKSFSKNVSIGANKMNSPEAGAFTENLASKLLKDAGAQFVLLGTSENREFFGETNEVINKKLKKLLSVQLFPVLCVGESLKEFESSQSEAVIHKQITEALADIPIENIPNLLIAYEAPWVNKALHTPSVSAIEMGFNVCKKVLAQIFGAKFGKNVRLLLPYHYDIFGMPDFLKKLQPEGLYFDQSLIYTEVRHLDFNKILEPIKKGISVSEEPPIKEKVITGKEEVKTSEETIYEENEAFAEEIEGDVTLAEEVQKEEDIVFAEEEEVKDKLKKGVPHYDSRPTTEEESSPPVKKEIVKEKKSPRKEVKKEVKKAPVEEPPPKEKKAVKEKKASKKVIKKEVIDDSPEIQTDSPQKVVKQESKEFAAEVQPELSEKIAVSTPVPQPTSEEEVEAFTEELEELIDETSTVEEFEIQEAPAETIIEEKKTPVKGKAKELEKKRTTKEVHVSNITTVIKK